MTMKKILLSFLALGGLLFASSCQMNEPDAGTLTGEVDFSITAGIPSGITTYAPGDEQGAFSHLGGINNVTGGDYVLRFILEVYDGEAVAYEETQYLENFSTPQVTFNPRLLAKEYDFVFWADFVKKPSAEGSTPTDLYYSTANLSSIEYTEAVKNDPTVLTTDLVDAYYAKEEVNLTQSSQSLQVTLQRPFGKIRLLATDNPQNLGDPDSNIPTSATIAFTDAEVPTTFNARTGKASDDDLTLSISDYIFTAKEETDPVVTGHTDLESAYLLGQTYFFESPSSTAYDMTVTVRNGGTQIGYRELTNIPVSANKLTTVIGNFYTNEGNLEVIVEDKFGGGEVLVSAGKWDGTTTADPDIDDDNKTIIISSPDQLAGLAKLVNEGKPYQEYTVTLMTNIDLNGHEWTPIGTGIRKDGGYTDESHSFQGTFDGNGNTIYNLSITTDPKDNPDQAIGLFGIVDGGTVKDLKFDNVNINVPSSEMAAAAVGMLTGGGTVSGIEVVSGKIIAKRGNGAVVGRMTKSGTIEDCINSATVSGSDSNVGGIVGAAYYTEQDSKMIISNCTNYGKVSCTAPVSVVGGIVGLSAADVINCINEGTIIGNGTDVAGIVAEQQNAGSIKDCVNKGDITNSSSAYGTGGIVGWIRYNGATSAYPVKNVIEVSGNTNYGSVQGGNDAGGIVGTVYNFGNITANNNYAPTLKATTFAAGIVGNAQFPQGNEGPIGMSGFQEMVNVKDNSTATSLDKITVEGSCKDLFVYINDQSKVTEENNTLLINDPEQFSSFATAVNNGNTFSGINVALGSDIDLNNQPWTPIGTNEHPFSGIFDGGLHTVSNLSIAAPDMNYVGLFGITKSTEAVVKNLTLTNVNITGRAQVGSMFGSSFQGTIENCHVNGNISVIGNYKVGGLTGEGYAKIINCSVIGNEGSTITGSYNAPDIEGDNVGGIIGYTGEGITGHSSWTVENLTVSGTRKVGGAIGYLNYNVKIDGVAVSNIIVSSNAKQDYVNENAGKMFVGGIVGEYSSSSTLPVISGSIKSSVISGPSSGIRVGGSRNVTYESRTAILENLTKDESTTATSIWYGESSPSNIMKDEAGKRIIVTDPAGFAALTDYLETVSGTASYSVIIDDDIDIFNLNSESWTPVRIYDYKGIDGNGIVVRNVKVEVNKTTGSNAGLFAEVSHISSNDGNIGIRNVNVENATIIGCNSGLGGSAGVLVGSVTLPITNCTVKNSSVTGGDYTGGIVGYSHGDVINCTVSETTVTGLRKDAGGLIGFLNNLRTITGNKVVENTSIAMNSTETEQNVGWLIGRWNYPTGSTLSGNSKDDTVTTENEVGAYVNGTLNQ